MVAAKNNMNRAFSSGTGPGLRREGDSFEPIDLKKKQTKDETEREAKEEGEKEREREGEREFNKSLAGPSKRGRW